MQPGTALPRQRSLPGSMPGTVALPLRAESAKPVGRAPLRDSPRGTRSGRCLPSRCPHFLSRELNQKTEGFDSVTVSGHDEEGVRASEFPRRPLGGLMAMSLIVGHVAGTSWFQRCRGAGEVTCRAEATLSSPLTPPLQPWKVTAGQEEPPGGQGGGCGLPPHRRGRNDVVTHLEERRMKPLTPESHAPPSNHSLLRSFSQGRSSDLFLTDSACPSNATSSAKMQPTP